jgi:hypothetical protein
VLLVLAEGVFFLLQGINAIPGSYMTGDPRWVVNGGIMVLVGVGLLLFANRKRIRKK